MSKPAYTFNEITDREQTELIIAKFNEERSDFKCEIEVYAIICEILYKNDFRAYLDGMYNRETDRHFNWESLMRYKTVVDFQIDWPYA
jgi:hypothetical protein